MKLFEKNVGKIDRELRGILGILILLVSFFLLNYPINYIIGLIGLLLLLTSIFGTCGLYSLLKINTCNFKI